MKKRLGLSAFAIFAAIGVCAAVAEPANLGTHKAEIRAYLKSGDYDREVAAVATKARAWLEERTKQGGGKLAMVFDLDETLLSNWPEMDREDFGFERTAFPAWIESGKCPAIEPVRELYRVARRLGVDVIFITGRDEHSRAATERNLREVGCGDFVALIFKPDGSKETAAALKTAARKRLTEAGHVIIANIGDQESDLAGGFAEKTFKLPNPVYISQ